MIEKFPNTPDVEQVKERGLAAFSDMEFSGRDAHDSGNSTFINKEKRSNDCRS